MKPRSMAKCSKFLRERPSHINYHRETTTKFLRERQSHINYHRPGGGKSSLAQFYPGGKFGLAQFYPGGKSGLAQFYPGVILAGGNSGLLHRYIVTISWAWPYLPREAQIGHAHHSTVLG